MLNYTAPAALTPTIATLYPTLQEAIDATPVGGTLRLPAGDYFLTGSGEQLLLVSKGMVIRGEGPASRLIVAASVPAETDVIRVRSTTNQIANLQMVDFSISAEAGRPARHGIHLDAQLGFNVIADAALQRLQIELLGGPGLAMTGPVPPEFDGVFTTVVSDCSIQGGFCLIEPATLCASLATSSTALERY